MMNKTTESKPSNEQETLELYQQIAESSTVRTTLATANHHWFFRIYFAHYITCSSAPFHKEMFHITQSEDIKHATIVAFRGSGKSTIVNTSYPIWSILGQQQKKFVLIVGRTQHQARQHMKNIKKELETNKLLKQDFGAVHNKSKEWSNNTLVFPKQQARIMAVSMQEGVRGVRHMENRPDLIICDDIEDLASVKTRDQRDKTYKWLTGEVIPAGNLNTKVMIIGNLLHRDSLIMRFKKQIEAGKIDGIYRKYPLLDENGSITWTGKYPDELSLEVERKKTGDEVAWQREYMLNIVPDSEQVIHERWLQFYDEIPWKELKDHQFRCFAAVDLAISQKETADYTAMVCAAVFRKGKDRRIYILANVVNDRISFLDTASKIEDQYKMLLNHQNGMKTETRPTIFIEDVGYQSALIEEMQRRKVNVEGVRPASNDKRSRLASVSDLVEGGEVYFPNALRNDYLIDQLVNFGSEEHDDLADAFAYCLIGIKDKFKHMRDFYFETF